MDAQKFDVNKLRVAKPCPTSWETMRGDSKVRFCDLCSLNVYNFSEMNRAEIQHLIAKSDGRICGRMYKRADGTVLTQDCPVGIRAYYKRTARFAGAAFAAILGLFSISFAQVDSKKDEKGISALKLKIDRTKNQSQESILSGTIFDKAEGVIPGAEITLYKADKKFSVSSNDEGKYKIISLPDGIYTLEIRALGFTTSKIIDLVIKQSESIQLNISLDAGEALTGVVDVAVEERLIDTKSSGVTTKITTKQIEKLPH